MSNKALEAIELALNDIDSSSHKLIIVPDDMPFTKGKTSIISLLNNFSVEDATALIGEIKHIGILNAEKFNKSKLSKLIKILTIENKATVIKICSKPVACKVFYPVPEIGTRHIHGNYEYSYGQEYENAFGIGIWQNSRTTGWSVKVIDKSQTEYKSPLTMIRGYPVTNMSCLFEDYNEATLNLIDWDTSNVTNMYRMFFRSQATSINGLNNFDTSKVINMKWMFCKNVVMNLDLSSFNTSKVTDMYGMFRGYKTTDLDVSGLTTPNVTDMREMFASCQVTHLDLSGFTTCKTKKMKKMFSDSKVQTLIAMTRIDAHNYTLSGNFPEHSYVTVDNKAFSTL